MEHQLCSSCPSPTQFISLDLQLSWVLLSFFASTQSWYVKATVYHYTKFFRQGFIASLSSVLRLKVVTITDKRVTMMSEIINSIRLIKMYAWEQPFTQRIDSLREEEVKNLKKSALLSSFSSTVSPSITIIAGFATFLTMTLAGVDLVTTKAFTILSIFNAMQVSFVVIVMVRKYISIVFCWNPSMVVEDDYRSSCWILKTSRVVGITRLCSSFQPSSSCQLGHKH